MSRPRRRQPGTRQELLGGRVGPARLPAEQTAGHVNRGGVAAGAGFARPVRRVGPERRPFTRLSQAETDTWAAKAPNSFEAGAKILNAANLPGDAIMKRYRELADGYINGTWRP